MHAQTAPQIPDREVAEPGELRALAAKRIELEQLRADMRVQSGQSQTRDTSDPRDRLWGVGDRETELRVGLAGRDVVLGLATDIWGYADEDILGVAAMLLQRLMLSSRRMRRLAGRHMCRPGPGRLRPAPTRRLRRLL